MAIRTETQGHVTCITIDRPEAMNALDAAATHDLEQALIQLRDDPEIWVGIVTGAGDKAFCAGADLRTSVPRALQQAAQGEATRHFLTRLELWKPLIAAINGHCLAGGLGLALYCDVRMAAEHATFGTMGTRRGILPGVGQTQRLTRAVPLALALELLFWGERISAQEAYRMGLVNRVVPQAELMPQAWRWAQELCQCAPLAVQAVKEAALRGLSLPLAEGLRLEQELSLRVRQTEDAQEGVRAFNEKRPPQFKGR